MTHKRTPSCTSRFAAFLAVALLTYAGVASTVMQVCMAVAPAAGCGMPDMPGMSTMPGMGAEQSAHAPKTTPAPSKAKAETCAFCADAAHAPLIAYAEPIRPPSSAIFVTAPARPPLGARAPPAFQPRARGPPSPLQTA